MNKQQNITPDFLFHIAQGFYSIAYNLAAKLKNDNSTFGFQMIAPAVVNFSFAVELFLKGLYAISKKSDLSGHRFYDLYRQLPISIKEKVELKYREQLLSTDDKLTKIKIVMSKASESEKTSKEESKTNDSMSVADLLLIHNDSFTNWRYLYETNAGGYEHEFDFKLINCFVRALIEVINEVKANKSPTFILTKPKI